MGFNSNYFTERIHCPACNCSHVTLSYSLPYSSKEITQYITEFYEEQGDYDLSKLEGTDYVLEQCEECSLVFQKYIPNDELLFELYEKWIEPGKVFNLHEKNYPLEYYSSQAEEIINIIHTANKKPSDITILDFGMGWGNWCLVAKSLGCNVYGCELSEMRIKHAEANGIQVISYDDIVGMKFDFINTEQVFEHLQNPLECLQHLVKSLNKNGRIKISVPDGTKVAYTLSKMNWKAAKGTKESINIVAPLEHLNCFNQKSLVKMAQNAGLSKIDVPKWIRIIDL